MKFIHGCRADALELYHVEGATHGAGTQVVFNGTPVDASTYTLATFGGSTTQMVDGSKVSAISTRPMRTTLKGFTYWWSPRALWFNLERSKRCMAEMSRLRGILSLFSAVENKLTVENKLKTPLSLDISAVHLLFCCDPKKNVCIVEAKSTDLWQGMAQALLGCEVQAEVCNLHEVFGIVTNYTRWWFLRSLDDKTEKETCSLVIEGNVPTSASQ
ncbi:hypothetical protein DYB28_013278 [Aphanomyces astaci]|uniref:Uncharacterized protein n=1 Tax=Aphanomyces astaci TaxID=112090 RepID=A0A9X8E4W0_APHAT|nr:hypothetical protein DYB28_013278 [Aphanomyces astaci]